MLPLPGFFPVLRPCSGFHKPLQMIRVDVRVARHHRLGRPASKLHQRPHVTRRGIEPCRPGVAATVRREIRYPGAAACRSEACPDLPAAASSRVYVTVVIGPAPSPDGWRPQSC